MTDNSRPSSEGLDLRQKNEEDEEDDLKLILEGRMLVRRVRYLSIVTMVGVVSILLLGSIILDLGPFISAMGSLAFFLAMVKVGQILTKKWITEELTKRLQ